MMDDVEGGHRVITLLSRQLACMLAQITDGAARASVRNEDTDNGLRFGVD